MARDEKEAQGEDVWCNVAYLPLCAGSMLELVTNLRI